MKILIYQSTPCSLSHEWEVNLRRILDQAQYGCDLDVCDIDEPLKSAIRAWDGKYDFLSLVTKYLMDTSETRLLISSADNKLKEYCIREAGHAKYGCCLGGNLFAVEYAPAGSKLSTQLHESLHLLGVDECYNVATTKAIAECDNENCVMRYGVDSTEVCNHVLRQLSR